MMGRLRNGVYTEPKVDELARVSESVINKYYGVEGRRKTRLRGQTGAGHDPEEDVDEPESTEEIVGELADEEQEDAMDIDERAAPLRTEDAMDIDEVPEPTPLEQEIHLHISRNTNKKPAPIAAHRRPFASAEEVQRFVDLVMQVEGAQYQVPERYGLGERSKWRPIHDIPLGKSKILSMSLPQSVWKPRALFWARALEVLNHVMIQ
jgi:hypothetical protein